LNEAGGIIHLRLMMTNDGEKEGGGAQPEEDLLMVVRDDRMSAFQELLQRGVRVKAMIGSTVQSFLCDGLGIDPQYVEERIQTVFLNGKAVDDPSSAVIMDNSIIALSAAMPGLLGATLRKGSYYSRMRSEISYTGEGKGQLHEGRVLLKLFNLLPREIGPLVLQKGVGVKGKDLQDFLVKRCSIFRQGCVDARLKGEKLDPARLAEIKWPEGEEVVIRVQPA
jgi:hypothetical protein